MFGFRIRTWVDLLPDTERRAFAVDFVRAVGASAELGRWSVLAQVLVEWKATAAVYADPALVEELMRPLNPTWGRCQRLTGRDRCLPSAVIV